MVSVAYLFLAILAVAAAAPENRIVGGDHVTIQEFPYVAAITYRYPGPGIIVQRCVGALVSSWHLVTSGFCFTGADLANMQVRAGSTNSLEGGILVNIANFIKHPDYTEVPRSNDLAVTFLASPLGISDVVNVLFLPPQNWHIADGQSVKVVSWGFESENGPQLPTLKTVFLNKLSVEDCQQAFEDTNNVVTVSDRVLCAAAAGKGMCMGDSGAPMVINQAIVGSSSFYLNCITDDYPDVFTRVDRYTNWILDVAAPGAARQAGFVNAPRVISM